MKKNFRLLLKAILISFFIAGLPSYGVNENYITVGYHTNTSIINPVMNPVGSGYNYNLNNLPVISLSGINSDIFKGASFSKDLGGLSSGGLYTSSINSFLNGDKDAGASKITRRPARLGMLMGWDQNSTVNSTA